MICKMFGIPLPDIKPATAIEPFWAKSTLFREDGLEQKWHYYKKQCSLRKPIEKKSPRQLHFFLLFQEGGSTYG